MSEKKLKTSKLNRIYEDDELVVYDKPSGLVVNRSHTYSEVTLQDIIEEEFPHENSLTNENDLEDGNQISADYPSDFIARSGIVHRLDKDTSGVILVAKKENIFKNLQKQFKKRQVRKEYCALVFGAPKDDLIEINAPIGRNPRSPLKFAVTSDGKDARTNIETVSKYILDEQKISYLNVYPKTGRTHQIRIHLSAIGHPVIGDKLYNTKKQFEWSLEKFPRMMLHARTLTIKHPITKDLLRFESPLPGEFEIPNTS